MQQHRARVGVQEAEIAELQQRVDMANFARTGMLPAQTKQQRHAGVDSCALMQ